ncbi:uncharacterized protein CDAR_219941 [Caerostris darwini]|uniref:Gustatory receptor n=1 Tax=Caerostris darwini TaxID=1538125 RepID=A0AAV4VIB9_9ARAC|nr:uncharacterized protein CDAR_219941 [Caerostris darwini]
MYQEAGITKKLPKNFGKNLSYPQESLSCPSEIFSFAEDPPFIKEDIKRMIQTLPKGKSLGFDVLAAVYAYIAYDEDHVATIWLYGNVVNGKKYKTAITFTSGYAYYVMYMELPIFITFSICTLLQRYGLFLLKYKKLLQITNFSSMSPNLMKLIDEYNKIENNMCLLKNTLSRPLFIMLLICFLNMYTALSAGIQVQHPSHALVELVSNTITGVLILFFLTWFSVRIPEYLLEIKCIIGTLIDRLDFNGSNGLKEMLRLYRIDKKKVIHLSACEIIQFRRGIFLSAFGVLFTYGLLISNVKLGS